MLSNSKNNSSTVQRGSILAYFFNTLFVLFVFLGALSSCTKETTPPTHNNNTNDTTATSDLTDTTLLNVSYGTDEEQKYDIYLPEGRSDSTPVILMIHGGAWKAGQKEDFNPYIQLIQNKWKNVAIVNLNYRLASNANNIHHAEIMQDIKAAIGDVLAKKDTYHISEKMGIVGASAGGQLAMIYAYKYNDYHNIECVGNIFGPSIINDWAWYSSFNLWLGANVSDIITEYVGQPWDSTAYANVSPYLQVSESSQPTIIFHGSLDPIVPVYQSQWFRNKLNGLNVTNEYYEYFAFHGFDATQSTDAVQKMVAFFQPFLE
ncbi:MAG: alpha/beta hydrolase [Chitinophagales bacterium]|nr:alpha/beta hydrolase [Chitinophagales bacterium]